MAHYLTKENCKIEKKHYSVLIRFVNEWEEAFWNNDNPEQKILSDSARYYIGISLFKAYNQIVANTLDSLYNRELASAYRLFPSEKLRTAIQNAFETERTLYSDTLGTWCDYRDTSAPASAMNGYCSGAPGMGSVYLKLHGWGITDFDNDLEKAISKVVSTEIMPRDHYCCGNSSSIEFLLDAGRELNRPDLSEAALRRLNEVAERKAATGEYTFLPERYEKYSPPGLMNGLSGVGHVLLKADNSSMNCLFI
ncbi:MAG: lanthionine synthetase LanC family protein [Ruminiclostridium sp.]